MSTLFFPSFFPSYFKTLFTSFFPTTAKVSLRDIFLFVIRNHSS